MCNSLSLTALLARHVVNVPPPPALGHIFIARPSGRRQCVTQPVPERLSVLLFLHL